MADQLIRLDSYPFDSNTPTTWDERGYPVFDRGITSYILAACWAQFFSDGVFAAPATNLQITRGTGFNINIKKGIGIIKGHMGGVFDDDGLNIKLTNEARGTMTYSIMLRYDNNNEFRSTYIHVVEGNEPATPETAPLVKELRLGYVVIPTNSSSIAEATIKDERGTQICPYAAPFEEIDLSALLDEAKWQAENELGLLLKFIETNKEFIYAAMDDSVAGHINNRLNALENPLRLTKAQLRYYLGIDNAKPPSWRDGWERYGEGAWSGDTDDYTPNPVALTKAEIDSLFVR